MILPKQVNLAELAYLQHQAEEEIEIQLRVIKARELAAGYFDEELAEETADFLIGGEQADIEGVNLMAIILNTVTRRLNLHSIKTIMPDMSESSGQQTTGDVSASSTSDGTSDGDPAQEAQDRFFDKVWEFNKIEVLQRDLHKWCERDGEAFLIIDWLLEQPWPRSPDETGLAKFYIHERFTDAGNSWKNFNGSGEGCKAHYRNDDHNQELDMVSKRWTEVRWEDEELKPTQRMTLYIAEQGNQAVDPKNYMSARIEKYVMGESGEWEQFKDETDLEWPIWWTDTQAEGGTSLPLPVVHFRNEEMVPGSKRVWGLQHGMDQLFSSFLGAGTMAGMQMLVALGFYPTTDGAEPNEEGDNLMKVGPRRIIGTSKKGPREASIDVIPPGEIDPILQAMDKLAIYSSFVNSAPVSNFVMSKAIASSETLRQGDAELLGRVKDLMELLTLAWKQVFNVSRAMGNAFSKFNYDENYGLSLTWDPPERRDVNYLKSEAEALRDAGVPEYQILQQVYNYSADEAKALLEKNLEESALGIGPEFAAVHGVNADEESNEEDAETDNTDSKQETT